MNPVPNIDFYYIVSGLFGAGLVWMIARAYSQITESIKQLTQIIHELKTEVALLKRETEDHQAQIKDIENFTRGDLDDLANKLFVKLKQLQGH